MLPILVKEIRIVSKFYTKDTEKIVNELLKDGWTLLHIGESGMRDEGISTQYTLGR